MVDTQNITVLIVAAIAIFTLLSSRYTLKKRTESNGYPVKTDTVLARLKRDLADCRFEFAILRDENSSLESENSNLKSHVDELKRRLAKFI
jgi:predicted RNase H-like nuclease (RuvC/YqgF family)